MYSKISSLLTNLKVNEHTLTQIIWRSTTDVVACEDAGSRVMSPYFLPSYFSFQIFATRDIILHNCREIGIRELSCREQNSSELAFGVVALRIDNTPASNRVTHP